jgi:hypothetical protein
MNEERSKRKKKGDGKYGGNTYERKKERDGGR